MCKYEFFDFNISKYGYYGCSDNTTPSQGYGCKKLTDINSVTELDNMYYCATGKGFGCEGDFKCKKTEYVKMCNDSPSPFARKDINSLDTSVNMTDFNNYLKLNSVKDFCDEYYKLCVETPGATRVSHNLFTKIINNGEKKILANKLGLKNEDNLTNSCIDIMNKYAKYCNNCTYDNIKKDDSKVNIYKKNINDTEIGYPQDKLLPAQIGKEESGVNLKQDEYYYISGDLDSSIEENKVNKTAINRKIINDAYEKFPNVLDFGTSSLSNVPDSTNGCIDNLSLEDAKTKCFSEDSCNGFYIYNDTSPSRVCFKGNIDIRKPQTTSSGPYSGFYIKK